jgi:hypothetical protein
MLINERYKGGNIFYRRVVSFATDAETNFGFFSQLVTSGSVIPIAA